MAVRSKRLAAPPVVLLFPFRVACRVCCLRSGDSVCPCNGSFWSAALPRRDLRLFPVCLRLLDRPRFQNRTPRKYRTAFRT
ncbi:hypothetical protein DWW78_05800 [Alistipes indistinctus]|nr:hypothetical protein [Alistipes indistinctus]RGU37211.1 hypothetical protein DWW78_05800 [Alistipes indistinctus]